MRRLLWLLCLAAALGGCASFARPVQPNEAPEPGKAYVYGRFSLTLHGSTIALLEPAIGYATVRMQCESGEQPQIAFSDEVPVFLLAFPPSRCALVELRFYDQVGNLLGARPPGIATAKFDLAPGRATYLGDWRMDVHRTKQPMGRIITSAAHWSAADAFDETARDLRARYRRFALYPLESGFPAIAEDDTFRYSTSYVIVPPPVHIPHRYR